MANQDVHIIEDGVRRFEPQKVDIKVGDTVTWINDGIRRHNAHRTIAPNIFDTGLLAQGEKKAINFTQVTDANGIGYSCTPHPDMTGTIVVSM